MSSEAIKGLASESWRERLASVRALGDAVGSTSTEAALVRIAGEDPVARVRQEALETLTHAGARVCGAALRALEDSDDRVRRAGARWLSRYGDRGSLPRLSNAVRNDRDWTVRGLCARALARCGGPEAISGLLAAARDPVVAVRAYALEGLGRLRVMSALDVLLGALKTAEDRGVRVAAARGLGCVPTRRATEGLIAALRDQAWEVRVAAAEGLGRGGDADAVAALAAVAIHDRSAQVRAAASRRVSPEIPSPRPVLAPRISRSR